MIEKLIEASIRNRFLVMIAAAMLTLAGVYAMYHTPVDELALEKEAISAASWSPECPLISSWRVGQLALGAASASTDLPADKP